MQEMQTTTLAALSRIEQRLDSIEAYCQSNSSSLTVSVLVTLFSDNVYTVPDESGTVQVLLFGVLEFVRLAELCKFENSKRVEVYPLHTTSVVTSYCAFLFIHPNIHSSTHIATLSTSRFTFTPTTPM